VTSMMLTVDSRQMILSSFGGCSPVWVVSSWHITSYYHLSVSCFLGILSNFFLWTYKCRSIYICVSVCHVADDKMPVITRLTLLMLCLIIYVMIKFRAREDNILYRYVSWNEFIHNMLAKGEVGCVLCLTWCQFTLIMIIIIIKPTISSMP